MHTHSHFVLLKFKKKKRTFRHLKNSCYTYRGGGKDSKQNSPEEISEDSFFFLLLLLLLLCVRVRLLFSCAKHVLREGTFLLEEKKKKIRGNLNISCDAFLFSLCLFFFF